MSNWRQFSEALNAVASSWLDSQILNGKISLWSKLKGPIDCFRFVIYQLNEAEPNYLTQCKQVRKPQIGDVAMYSWGNRTAHVGIWIGNNEVISKWGIPLNAYRHPIDEVFLKYGSHVFFVRKPHKSRMTPRIQEELKKEYFVKFECYSPYSVKGRVEQCRDWIERTSSKHISQSHPKALFGQLFQQRYTDRLKQALQKATLPLGSCVRKALAIAEATPVELDED